ncbi:hypothetical protein GTA08_BOTSDO08943 [Neofusicoccum parvum]|nr:hypothetical protein GTA08_BOTSDO08943 [Neofusicoccum parvum]
MPPTPSSSSSPLPPSRPPTAASDFSFGQAAANADPLPASVRSSVASFAQQNIVGGGHKRNDSGYADDDYFGVAEVGGFGDESDTLPTVERRAGGVRGKAGVVLGLGGGEDRGEGEWVDEGGFGDEGDFVEEGGEEEEEEEEEDLGPVVEESWLFDGVLERNVKRESERAKGEVAGAAAAGGKRIGFDVGEGRQGGLKERKSVLGIKRVKHGSVEERSAGVGTRVWIGYD